MCIWDGRCQLLADVMSAGMNYPQLQYFITHHVIYILVQFGQRNERIQPFDQPLWQPPRNLVISLETF